MSDGSDVFAWYRWNGRVHPAHILARAIMEWKPVKIYAMYSGGDHSMASTHLAMTNGAHEVLHLKTGIGLKPTLKLVRDNCTARTWPLREEPPPLLSYLEMCAKYGVPGPGAHLTSYVWLKERALDKVVRETKRKRMDRVMLVTGVHRSESARRMGYVEPVHKDGCSIWVAPFFDHTGEEIDDYMDEHDLPKSPIKKELGLSGECLCGAFGDRAREFPIINRLDPECAAMIVAAEWAACANKKPDEWGRARKPRKRKRAKFMPLCVGCEQGLLFARVSVPLGNQQERIASAENKTNNAG